jgi:hypothetical protein
MSFAVITLPIGTGFPFKNAKPKTVCVEGIALAKDTKQSEKITALVKMHDVSVFI